MNIKYQKIQTPRFARYMTLAESVKLNGERHLANAVGYAARGLPEYAAGSLRKAYRNFERAKLLTPPKISLQLETILAEMQKAIADSIMG